MAALTSIAALVGAGASVYGSVRQAQQTRATQVAQARQASEQDAARQQELLAARDTQRAERQQTLARTVATARARLAAGGISPDDGSAAALTTGLTRDAAEAERAADDALAARLARGRSSLLNPDGSFTAALSGARTLGAAVRSLLD